MRGLVVAVAGLFVSMMMFFADGGIDFVGPGYASPSFSVVSCGRPAT